MRRPVDPHEVRWDRVALDPRSGYVGRLVWRGAELWACDHRHTGRGAARACAYRAWQALRDWLTAGDAAA